MVVLRVKISNNSSITHNLINGGNTCQNNVTHLM